MPDWIRSRMPIVVGGLSSVSGKALPRRSGLVDGPVPVSMHRNPHLREGAGHGQHRSWPGRPDRGLAP